MNRGVIICIFGGIGAILFGSEVFLNGNSTPAEPNVMEEDIEDSEEFQKDPLPRSPGALETDDEFAENLVRNNRTGVEYLERLFIGWKADEDAANLMRKVSELKAMIPKRKVTLDEAISANDELGKKLSDVQDEFQKYMQKVAQKRRNHIEEFSFLDVTFNVKRPAFLSVLPADESEPYNSDKDRACGLTSYVFVNLKSVSSASYKFIDDDLYEMHVSYDYDKLDDLGGYGGIQNRLLQKFGPPDFTHPDSLLESKWIFPEHGREITLQMFKTKNVYITASHLARLELVKQREAAYERWEQKKAESRNAGF